MPAAVLTAFSFITAQTVAMVEIIMDNPVLCLGVAIWAVGATIGLFKRLV